MNIPTIATIRAARRLQDRRRAAAACVIAAMEQRGLTLNLMFTKHGSAFTLSDGTPVSAETALMVVNDVRVVSVNDGLFPQTPQTWRCIGE